MFSQLVELNVFRKTLAVSNVPRWLPYAGARSFKTKQTLWRGCGLPRANFSRERYL